MIDVEVAAMGNITAVGEPGELCAGMWAMSGATVTGPQLPAGERDCCAGCHRLCSKASSNRWPVPRAELNPGDSMAELPHELIHFYAMTSLFVMALAGSSRSCRTKPSAPAPVAAPRGPPRQRSRSRNLDASGWLWCGNLAIRSFRQMMHPVAIMITGRSLDGDSRAQPSGSIPVWSCAQTNRRRPDSSLASSGCETITE